MPEMMPTMTYTEAVLTFLASLSLILMSVTVVIYSSITEMPAKNLLFDAVLFAVNLFYFHMVYDACGFIANQRPLRSITGTWFIFASRPLRILIMLAIILLTVNQILHSNHVRKQSINTFAISESFDALPVGIAFAGKNGEVYQTNRVIEELSHEILGRYFINANEFWERICGIYREQTDEQHAGDSEPTPIIRMADGRVWLFRKDRVHTEIGDAWQYLATDVTTEQRLLSELDSNVERLKSMNRRLRRYQDTVDDTVREEELLAAKLHVHDSMGTALLMARMYILNEDSPATREQILHTWYQDMTLLSHEGDEPNTDADLERLQDAAAHLGIHLQIMGELPKTFDVLNLVYLGVQECLTNAYQHAHATQMYVIIARGNSEYRVDFSNNGEDVQMPIKEGGGLTLLRTKTEHMGGTMTYADDKRFRLMLRIPIPESED